MNKPVQTDADTPDLDFGEMAGSLGLLLRLAQIKVFEGFYKELGHHGLKPGEFTMLWLIGLNPDTRQGVIARRLRIKPAHMTKLVQRAVDKGLLERNAPDEDRRAIELRLSKAGQRFVDDKKRDFLAFIAKENQLLGNDDYEFLIRTLQKLTDMEPNA